MADYDVLKIYKGDDIKIDDNIIIHQPTIGEIIDFGEYNFWNVVNKICGNPTSMRLELWDVGIDWNEISDYDLFILLLPTYNIKDTSIIFGDLDFNNFIPIEVEGENVLIDKNNPEIQIDKNMYELIVGYLRIIFDIHPKVEKAKGKYTKEAIIEEDRFNLNIERKKREKQKWKPSILFPIISAAINHPGFKYSKNEVFKMGIFEFMDSIKRIQLYENVVALMSGIYTGMIDTSKINLDKELNWVRDLYE